MDANTRLLDHVRNLMRAFLVNETAFPSAEGRMVFSPQVFQALYEGGRAPGLRASDLAGEMGLVPTTASSLIARLVRNGLIERRRSATDGRAAALFLTDKGESLRAAIHRQDMANMAPMLSALSDAEQDQLLGLLDKVSARVTAAANPGYRRDGAGGPTGT